MGGNLCRQRREDRPLEAEEKNESAPATQAPGIQTVRPRAFSDPLSPRSKLLGMPESSAPHTPLRKAGSQAVLKHAKAGQINNNGQCTHALMMEDYVTKSILSTTHDSTVELCRQLSTDSNVVVKIFNRGLLERKSRRSLSRATSSPMEIVLREVAIMQKLQHPNIVQQIDMIDSAEGMLYIVMEYVPGGPTMRWNELEMKYDSTVQDKADGLSVARSRSYFRDALLGLEYIHAQNIVHRDIKPENLLVDRAFVPGGTPETEDVIPHVKIADFGVSCFCSVGDDYLNDTQGTLLFAAPESFSGEPYKGKQADIWALGVTLYCFLFQNVPFEGRGLEELEVAILQRALNFPEGTDGDLKDLLCTLLHKDPEKRYSIAQLKAHPWVLRGTDLASLPSPVDVKRIDVSEEEIEQALQPKPKSLNIAMIGKIKLQMRKLKNAAKIRSSPRLDPIEGSPMTPSQKLSEGMPPPLSLEEQL